MVAVSSSKVFSCSAWLEGLAQSRPATDFELLRKACLLAEELYQGAVRLSKEPYLEHALAVARLLSELRLDVQTLAAAVLHDVPEVAADKISRVEALDPGLVLLIKGVQRLEAITRRRAHQGTPEDHEGLRKLLLSVEEDMRVLLIKLAERVHDLRCAKQMPAPERQRIASETMDLYAPLANRLGMGRLKWELEDLSFRALDPEVYQKIASFLDERRLNREDYLKEITTTLRENLTALHAEVSGRPKHIYSIWRKMRKKGVDFEQIYDVRAVRVLVPTVSDCYTALGVVHALWLPIPSEFDDYIARPKNNFYRSLHTAVVGPEGKVLEVQIRTHDMHRHAELGVAAHWRYKEGGQGSGDYQHRIQWLQQFLALDETIDPKEFVEKFRQTLQYEQIHVFTPKGQVIDLPRGSTPLDFAYRIHSEVGHRCRGAKIDGHIVPLSYSLRNGQQVEILTVKQGGPSQDWLNPEYLHTNRAREKVRQWFKQAHYEENKEQGRAILEKELARLEKRVDLQALAQRMRYTTVEDLMVALGRGDATSAQVTNALGHLLAGRQKQTVHRPHHSSAEVPTLIRVQGVSNLLTKIAQCCKPKPGEPIVGYVTHDQGIRIHRADCASLQNLGEGARAKRLEAVWTTSKRDTWPVRVQVVAHDRPGLLRDLTALTADNGINILTVNTHTDPVRRIADMRLTLEVNQLEQISQIFALAREIKSVIRLRRLPDA